MGDIIADVITFLDERNGLSDFVKKSQENAKKTTEIMSFILKD